MELIETFEAIASSDSHDQSFWQIIKSCGDLKVLSSKPHNKIQPIVGHINRKLNTSSTRANGLHLLKVLVPQCSDQVFSENAVSWMSQCLKGIEGHSKLKTGQIACETFQLLLESAVLLPELTKPITASVVPKFLDLLPNVPREISWFVLKCLQVVIRNYGGPCGPNRNVVERFVLKFVDEKCGSLVDAASHCVALFPLMGGGGTGGLNHSSAWLSLQQQLIATMNQLLDDLFQNITEIQTARDTSVQTLILPVISEDNPTVAVHRFTRRFINVAEFLQQLYMVEFPVAKSVLPLSVFGLVCRGLAVTNKTLGRDVSNEKLALGSVLPEIHAALFKILRSLVACCGSSLLQYGSLICKLVLQTLKWTEVSNWNYGMEKPYCALRTEACNTLVSWVRCAKAGSCVELHADALVSLLKADIVSTPPTVTLTAQHASSKHLSKQQRKKLKTMSGGDTEPGGVDPGVTRVRLVDNTANHKLCVAALQALLWIIRAGGLFVQPSVHKSLQETVTPLLLDILRASGPAGYPIPYSVPGCRQALYSLLVVLTLDSHPGWPAPTQYALRVFAAGQMDPSAEVSASCAIFLHSVRNLVHPIYPSLEFPMPALEVQESAPAAKEVSSVPRTPSKGGRPYLNGSASPREEERVAKSKKRISSGDDVEEIDDHQSKKRRKSEKNARAKSRSVSPVHEILEETLASESEDDVKEIYQINDDNILSRLKSKSTRLTEITFEEDYIVEETIDEESAETIRDLYARKKLGRKTASVSSAEGSMVQITELVEEVEEIEIEQPIRKQTKNDSTNKTALTEKEKVSEARTDCRSAKGVSIEAEQSDEDCVPLESESEDGMSSDEIVEVEPSPIVSLDEEEGDDDDGSVVVQISSASYMNDCEYVDVSTSGENVSSSADHAKSDEDENIEEIDISKDEIEDEDGSVYEEDNVEDENTKQKSSSKLSDVNVVDMEESAGSESVTSKETTKLDKSDDEGASKDLVREREVTTVEKSSEVMAKSPTKVVDLEEEEDAEKEAEETITLEGDSKNLDEEREEPTEPKSGSVTEETPVQVVDLEEEKEGAAKEVQETSVPDTSASGEVPPVMNGTSEMEVDEDEMMASFIDVLSQDVPSTESEKSAEKSVQS